MNLTHLSVMFLGRQSAIPYRIKSSHQSLGPADCAAPCLHFDYVV